MQWHYTLLAHDANAKINALLNKQCTTTSPAKKAVESSKQQSRTHTQTHNTHTTTPTHTHLHYTQQTSYRNHKTNSNQQQPIADSTNPWHRTCSNPIQTAQEKHTFWQPTWQYNKTNKDATTEQQHANTQQPHQNTKKNTFYPKPITNTTNTNNSNYIKSNQLMNAILKNWASQLKILSYIYTIVCIQLATKSTNRPCHKRSTATP